MACFVCHTIVNFSFASVKSRKQLGLVQYRNMVTEAGLYPHTYVVKGKQLKYSKDNIRNLDPKRLLKERKTIEICRKKIRRKMATTKFNAPAEFDFSSPNKWEDWRDRFFRKLNKEIG